MTVNVYSKEVKDAMKKSSKKALVGIGAYMQDALADNTHRVSGLLANSYNYRTKDSESDFGTGIVTNAKETLGEENKVSQPGEDTVRIGSVLSYSIPYNRRFKVMEKTVDSEQKRFGEIANKAYNKEIGT